MPGDEQKSINRTENHARLAIISSTMSLQTTVSHKEGYRSVSLVLAILKNCLKRLREAHTTRTKPGPRHG